MDSENLLNISEGFKGLGKYYLGISLVLLIIVIIILVVTIKGYKDKKLKVKIISIMVLIILFLYFIDMLILGLDKWLLANKVKKDSVALRTEQICGEVEETYCHNKSSFIVINSEHFLLVKDVVDKNIYFGEEYCISYYVNSKLICKVKDLEN